MGLVGPRPKGGAKMLCVGDLTKRVAAAMVLTASSNTSVRTVGLVLIQPLGVTVSLETVPVVVTTVRAQKGKANLNPAPAMPRLTRLVTAINRISFQIMNPSSFARIWTQRTFTHRSTIKF